MPGCGSVELGCLHHPIVRRAYFGRLWFSSFCGMLYRIFPHVVTIEDIRLKPDNICLRAEKRLLSKVGPQSYFPREI